MTLYQIVYEIDGQTDWLEVASDEYIDTEMAYELAIKQATEVWGADDEPYKADDITELTCVTLDRVGSKDGKRQFKIVLEEIE